MSVNYVIWTKKVHIKITSTYLLRDEIFEKITKIDHRYTCTCIYSFSSHFKKNYSYRETWMDIHRMRDRWINGDGWTIDDNLLDYAQS